MTALRLCLTAATLLAGALLFACGGGGGDDDGDRDGTEPTATEEVVDGEATPGDGDDEGGDASQELSELAGRFAEQEVKISYDLSSTVDGETQEGSFTFYWKPPDAWRMDFNIAGSEGSLITTGETSYLCSSEGGEGQCLESPAGLQIPLPFLEFFTDPDSLGDIIDTELAGLDVDRSDREIAGRDATCFTASGEVEGESGEVEYCFSDDGVLLLLRSSGETSGEFSLEATSVETSVSDADLEPPYDILEIPGQ